MLQHVQYSDSLTSEEIPARDKFWILVYRHSIPKETLLNYTGKDLLEQILFQMRLLSIYETSISNLVIHGDTLITAEMRQMAGQMMEVLNFYLEDSIWKMDLRRMLAGSEDVIKQLLIPSGKLENETILDVLESFIGIKPSSSIWSNLK